MSKGQDHALVSRAANDPLNFHNHGEKFCACENFTKVRFPLYLSHLALVGVVVLVLVAVGGGRAHRHHHRAALPRVADRDQGRLRLWILRCTFTFDDLTATLLHC